MNKVYLLFLFIFSVLSGCFDLKEKGSATSALNLESAMYSKAVKDSFYISVQLPDNYFNEPGVKYPTVYVLDANFHFPILASTVKQYEQGGLLPPLILVGIGYQSFQLMDSLRVRDYLYPAAIPSDEMSAVGGGDNFNDFITSQLVPYIDSGYRTQENNRSLLGHSFGGYFSLYALLKQLHENKSIFKNFSAASPSLWYNNFFLNQLTDKLRNRQSRDTLNVLMTVGGLEDSTWNMVPVKKLGDDILSAKIKNLNFKYSIYSELAHMDVAMVTFTKALQLFYKEDD